MSAFGDCADTLRPPIDPAIVHELERIASLLDGTPDKGVCRHAAERIRALAKGIREAK